MKKKILSIFLLICVLVPCFAVFTSAEGATEDDGIAHFDNNLTVATTSTGNEYRVGYNKYIDVEKYAQNAHKSGYKDFQVIAVEEVYYEDYISLYIYCFNTQYYIDYDKNNDGNGYIQISTPGVNETFEIPVDLMYYSDNEDFLFPVFSLDIPSGSEGLELYNEIDSKERIYDIQNLVVCNDYISEHYVTVPINRRYIFKGFNSEKTVEKGMFCNFEYSSPLDDLTTVSNSSRAELVESYPTSDKEPEPILLYEYNAGEEDYSLYLYVYNPQERDYYDGIVYFYIDNTYKSFAMKHIRSDGVFSKFKIMSNLSSINDNLPIREYFISNISLAEMKLANGRLQRVFTNVSTEARFVYSDIPSESFTPSTFVYDMSGYKITAPSFAGNGTGVFLQGEEYLVTFETKDINRFEISGNPSIFEITEQGETWVKIKTLAGSSEYINFNTLMLHSTFPDQNYPDLSVSITRAIPEGATEEEKANITTGSTSVDVDVNFAPTRIYPVMNVAEGEEEYVEPNAKYLTAEVDGEIKIDANYTYYRLDSSVNGNGYYQTLSTLYFSIPNKYLQSTDIPVVDSYVKALEISYQSAMTKPFIHKGQDDKNFDKIIEQMNSDYYGEINDAYPFLSSLFYVWNDEGIVSSPEIFICNNDFTKINFATFVNISLSGNQNYGFDSLVLTDYNKPVDIPDIYGGEHSEINDLYSTYELNQIINNIGTNNVIKDSFENNQFILNFDETKSLESFNKDSLAELFHNFGYYFALKMRILGTKNEYMTSINEIEAIKTLSYAEMNYALLMSDDEFSSKYFVSLADVAKIKKQIEYALSNNETFVFARFDVFDYFSDYMFGGVVTDDIVKKCELVGLNTICFQTKYYKDLDVLRIETGNKFSTKLYKVDMDEINTSGGGVTAPEFHSPNTIEGALTDKNSLLYQFIQIVKICAILMVVVPFLAIIIYISPFVVNWFRKIKHKKSK